MPVSPPNNTNRSARESYAIAAPYRPDGPVVATFVHPAVVPGSRIHVSLCRTNPGWLIPPKRSERCVRASYVIESSVRGDGCLRKVTPAQDVVVGLYSFVSP